MDDADGDFGQRYNAIANQLASVSLLSGGVVSAKRRVTTNYNANIKSNESPTNYNPNIKSYASLTCSSILIRCGYSEVDRHELRYYLPSAPAYGTSWVD